MLTMLALLWGCAVTPQPFAYRDDRDEKPGPGLFSGDQGAYTVYGEPSDTGKAEEETPAGRSPPE